MDFEDLVIDYIHSDWNARGPNQGLIYAADHGSEANTISFKPGFPDHFRPYECATVQKRTLLVEQFSNSKFDFTTTLDITLPMKSMTFLSFLDSLSRIYKGTDNYDKSDREA